MFVLRCLLVAAGLTVAILALTGGGPRGSVAAIEAIDGAQESRPRSAVALVEGTHPSAGDASERIAAPSAPTNTGTATRDAEPEARTVRVVDAQTLSPVVGATARLRGVTFGGGNRFHQVVEFPESVPILAEIEAQEGRLSLTPHVRAASWEVRASGYVPQQWLHARMIPDVVHLTRSAVLRGHIEAPVPEGTMVYVDGLDEDAGPALRIAVDSGGAWSTERVLPDRPVDVRVTIPVDVPEGAPTDRTGGLTIQSIDAAGRATVEPPRVMRRQWLAQGVMLEPGEARYLADPRRTILPLKVRVRWDDGTPLPANAPLFAVAIPEWRSGNEDPLALAHELRPAERTRTDASGVAAFEHLPVGRWCITTQGEDPMIVRGRLVRGGTSSPGRPEPLLPAATVIDHTGGEADLVVPRGVRAHGQVLRRDGTPLANHELREGERPGTGGASVRTDDQGHFDLGRRIAGTFHLRFTADYVFQIHEVELDGSPVLIRAR